MHEPLPREDEHHQRHQRGDDARVDEHEGGGADADADDHTGQQPGKIGLRPVGAAKGAQRENIHQGDERRHHDGGIERIHHQG